MNFRREPIRSRRLLDSARGQPCALEFVGVCSHDVETTVSAHIHDESAGRGVKADDTSSVHSCDRCHMFLDHGWVGKISPELRSWHIIRGLQRTLRNRIERGVLWLKPDNPKPVSARPTRKRKPKDERAKTTQRADPWPARGSRKLPPRRAEVRT